MKILVLNSGSSSVKYKLIDLDGSNDATLAEGGVEKIGLAGGFLKYKKADGSKAIDELGLIDHLQAIKAILAKLTDPTDGCIKSYDEIEAVGHRVVHGGEKFSESVLIDDAVKEKNPRVLRYRAPAQPCQHDRYRRYHRADAQCTPGWCV